MGVRWNTVMLVACRAINGMGWIPDEPVPMTAIRLSAESAEQAEPGTHLHLHLHVDVH